VPSIELINDTVARLDGSLVDAGGTVGKALRDAPVVVAHTGARQRYGAPCGLWLVDQRRVGHVEANGHARWAAGLLADTDGRVLAELQKRRRKVVAAVRGESELARIVTSWRGETIELATPARPWPMRWRRRSHDLAIFDGEALLACGTARRVRIMWRDNREHTTAIWLRHDLTLDERAVVLLALLHRLGPPDAPPA
jgi:hypothetical protein